MACGDSLSSASDPSKSAPQGAASPTGNSAAPAVRINVDFSTRPNPPSKGMNAARAHLTDERGQPITDAETSAVFLMPAMPEMGMAAARVEARLASKGNGDYEGQFTLDSGGTYQVSITVRRNGQVVATRQLTISAEGGM